MSNHYQEEKNWWKRNKKKILTIGSIVVIGGIGIVVFKNKDVIAAFLKARRSMPVGENMLPDKQMIETKTISASFEVLSQKPMEKQLPLNGGMPFNVSSHIRNLPNGYCPSVEKLEEAKAMGITLGPHQTLIPCYQKNNT